MAYRDTGGEGLPVVLLHGAGFSSAVFARQFGSPLAETRRLIAIDLPGHGHSDRSPDPAHHYTIPAVADLVAELFDRFGLEKAIVFGWSLGGHLAIEMMQRHPSRLAGAMISGTPPLARGSLGVLRAFHMRRELLLLSKAQLTPLEARRLARFSFAEHTQDHHVASILQSDGMLRTALRHSLLRGDGGEQRHVVETSPLPLAVVNGRDEPVARLSYLDTLNYANLWEGRCHVINGAAHAAFYTSPHAFNALLHRFALDVEMRSEIMPPIPQRRSA